MERPSSEKQTTATATTTGHGHQPWRPSPAQLKLLRILAGRAGQTFERPTNARGLRSEIARLREAAQTPAVEQAAGAREQLRVESREVSEALSQGPASSVKPHEIEGYGSSAHYATGSQHKPEDDRARGDERCRATAAFPNPYYPGQKIDKDTILSRGDARRLYRRWLWKLIDTHGQPVIAKLASLHGQLNGCYCRVHPCEREVLADAAEWAAGQLA